MKLYTEDEMRAAFENGISAGHPMSRERFKIDDYEAFDGVVMPEIDINQLELEVKHIFDSGANEIRVVNMVKAFTRKFTTTLKRNKK